jgi:LPXTG-motif cell wall-anchored protein
VLAGLSVASLAVGLVIAPSAYATPPPPPPPGGDAVKCFAHQLTIEGTTAKATVVLRGHDTRQDLAIQHEDACKKASLDVLLVSYTKSTKDVSFPQWVYKSATGTVDKDHPKLELTVALPPCFWQVDLVAGKEPINPLTEEHLYKSRILGSDKAPGNASYGKLATKYGGDKECAAPTVTSKSDCSNLTITVANPADGILATVKVTWPTGSTTFDVSPGKTAAPVVIPGSTGLVATVVTGVKGAKDITETKVSYTKPTTGCVSPLPVTGVNAAATAGIALGLVGIGGGLFWAARRRRVMFTS